MQNQVFQKSIGQPESSNQHISYSRLAAEIEEEDKHIETHSNLLKNPYSAAQPASRPSQNILGDFQKEANKKQIIHNEDGPQIMIHFSSHLQQRIVLPNPKNPSSSTVEKQRSQRSSIQMSSSRSQQIRFVQSGLKAIQQHQLENKRSDDEVLESQHSVPESQAMKGIKIQSMNCRKPQMDNSPADEPGISNTTKRSKQEKQSTAKVYIRPTDKSIELEQEQEEKATAPRNKVLAICCKSINELVRPYRSAQGRGMTSSYSTVTKNRLTANPSKDEVTKKNQNQISRSQFEVLLQKISHFQDIVQELKGYKTKRIENTRESYLLELEQLKKRLRDLESKKALDKARSLDKNREQKVRSISIKQYHQPHRFYRVDSSKFIINHGKAKIEQKFTYNIEKEDLRRLCHNPFFSHFTRIHSSNASSKSAILYRQIQQILGLFEIESGFDINIKEDRIEARIKENNWILILQPRLISFGAYESAYKNIYLQGEGIQIEPLKSAYYGQFHEGMKSGQGKYVQLSKYYYNGSWSNNQKWGSGFLQYEQSRDIYQGQFQNDMKSGRGVQRFAKGDLYEGIYRLDYFQQYGMYKWKSGDVYRGEFRRGVIEGQGEWVSSRGNTYCGSFHNNLKHGWGVYKQKNGAVYEGFFQNGKRCEMESPARQLRRYRGERFLSEAKRGSEDKQEYSVIFKFDS